MGRDYADAYRIDTIERGNVTAFCQKWDGQFQKTTFNLDEYIGVEYGQLSWGGRRFSSQASDIKVDHKEIMATIRELGSTPKARTSKISLTGRLINFDGALYAVPSNRFLSSKQRRKKALPLKFDYVDTDYNKFQSKLEKLKGVVSNRTFPGSNTMRSIIDSMVN